MLFGPAATLEVELGGLLPGSEFDRLSVAGQATIDGSLDVSLINGFAPSAGNSFEILAANGGVFGEFDFTSLPALPGGLAWNVVYANSSVVLEVASVGLPGDFNLDGSVDAADYVVAAKGLGTTHTPGDYDIWRAHFGETAGSGSASARPPKRPCPNRRR